MIAYFVTFFVMCAVAQSSVPNGSLLRFFENDSTCCATTCNGWQYYSFSPIYVGPQSSCTARSCGTTFYPNVFTNQICNTNLPAYTNPNWIYHEFFWASSNCSTTPQFDYNGAYAPNSQCVRNYIGIGVAGTISPQAYIKVVCQASVLSWVTCDDSLCSSNCIAGSAPANNGVCTPQGQGSVTGSNMYHKYWCPGVTTAPPPTVSSTVPPVTTQPATPPAVSPVTTWTGNYRVTSACSTASCCCLTGNVNAVQSGTSIVITGSLVGSCGATPTGVSQSFTISLTSSTSGSASFTFLNQPFMATLVNNVLTLNNLNFPACSGTATRSSMASYVAVPTVALLAIIFLFF